MVQKYMSRPLPPLNALRVFEATSRHLSAKLAAKELHVTPAAISHQLKELESFLGISLFNRLPRQLQLTEAGKNYATSLQQIFQQLILETRKLTQSQKNTLLISAEPAFALHWLTPRLAKFKNLHPDIDLRVTASYAITDFDRSDIDMAIRWGKGHVSGLAATLLFYNELYPVCSPLLLKKHSLRKPNDLKHFTLLHETSALQYPGYPNWRKWLKAAKADQVDPNSGLFIETGYLLIQAATSGQGIALERHAFIEPAIKAGYLVKPFDFTLMEEKTGGYFLVYPEEKAQEEKLLIFREWLLKEIEI